MDGTLLDLHFDNHFLARIFFLVIMQKKNNLQNDEAKRLLMEEYKKLEGKLEWYCLDYWNQRLDLDMVSLKREISHLIKMRDDTIPFLDALKRSGRQVMLLTNAHPGSLALKVEHTNLDDHIDTLISTHEFGVPKEHQSLWEQVFATYQLDKKRTLFRR